MARLRLIFCLVVTGCLIVALRAEQAKTFTQKLTDAYDAAWDRSDIPAMVEMLDPECVFRSPFQIRLGREAIREHVFRNTRRFRDTVSTETLSKIEDDVPIRFRSPPSTTTAGIPATRSSQNGW